MFLLFAPAANANVSIEMLDKDANGNKMVFSKEIVKIAVGDTVNWIQTSKGHNVEMLSSPNGLQFKSGANKTVTITRDMLPQDVRDDLNKTITYDRLAPSALDAIFSTSLASITAGKIKIVSFGQNPPTGYSLYHRGKAENLIWKFTSSSPSPGATFDKTIIWLIISLDFNSLVVSYFLNNLFRYLNRFISSKNSCSSTHEGLS